MKLRDPLREMHRQAEIGNMIASMSKETNRMMDAVAKRCGRHADTIGKEYKSKVYKIWWKSLPSCLLVSLVSSGIMLALTSTVIKILIVVVMVSIIAMIFRWYLGALSGAEAWLRESLAGNSDALRDEMDRIYDDFTIAANALLTGDGREEQERN